MGDPSTPTQAAEAGAPQTVPTAPAATQAQAPFEIPQKFLNADGKFDERKFITSYANMENILSTKGLMPANNSLSIPAEAGEPASASLPEDATTSDHLKSMGLDEEAMAQQFVDKGHLTPTQYKTLAKNGMPRVFVDAHYKNEVELAQIHVGRARDESIEFAGGKEQLDTLLNWATQNLPEARHSDLDKRLQNPATMLAAVKELWADHKQAIGAGKAQPLLTGSGAGPTSSGGFATQREMKDAMNNPRYRTDPGYREETLRKLRATDQTFLAQGA